MLLKRPIAETSKHFLEELDPAVEWHPAMSVLLEATVYRDTGESAIRSEARRADLAEWHHDVSEIRDLGERVVVIGRVRVRGSTGGAETESPYGYVVDFRVGRAIRIRSYLDPKQALEAAGVAE